MTWAELPECILCEVYRYLCLADRHRASLVCQAWNDCFHCSYVWTNCDLNFQLPQHSQLTDLVLNYGSFIRTLVLQVNQGVQDNRENACKALILLARSPGRRLERLRIRFTGNNPCMYNGQEFIDCLSALFRPPVDHQLENTSLVLSNGSHSQDETEGDDQQHEVDDEKESGDAAEGGKNPICNNEVPEETNDDGKQDDETAAKRDLQCGSGDYRQNSPFKLINDAIATKPIGKLKHVDLSGLGVNLDGQLLCLLAENNTQLESLDIQNRVLVSKVHPGHMLKVVTQCRKLKSLRLYSCSISEEILLKFTEDNRAQLEHLSIYHRREHKIIKDISSECWAKVISRLPKLRVTLGFDSTCPLHKVSEVMRPEIPVNILRLETYTDLWNEVLLASTYYRHTLEKLIVNSPKTRNCRELDLALLELTKYCAGLKALHVFCVLDKETIDQILERFPHMKERGSYTLKYVNEEHPWAPGAEYWP